MLLFRQYLNRHLSPHATPFNIDNIAICHLFVRLLASFLLVQLLHKRLSFGRTTKHLADKQIIRTSSSVRIRLQVNCLHILLPFPHTSHHQYRTHNATSITAPSPHGKRPCMRVCMNVSRLRRMRTGELVRVSLAIIVASLVRNP